MTTPVRNEQPLSVRPPIYESIGVGYARTRQPDARIATQIRDALGDVGSVLNVGAGAGSYEPDDCSVVAVEPSPTMLGQRGLTAAPAVQAVAEDLPFGDGSFDGAMAVLTVHHWLDIEGGIAEIRRVTRGPIVVLTWENDVHAQQWLVEEYFPAMLDLDTQCPSPRAIGDALGGASIRPVEVPADCTDGFCHAWWRRPEAYLDASVRAGISGIARLPVDYVDAAIRRLERDITSGAWHDRHADLLELENHDAGYRLVVAPNLTG